MHKKMNIILVVLFCLLLPISAFAVTYVNTGPTTENTGNVGVPTGSSYYINDVKQVLINKWDATVPPDVDNDVDEGYTAGSIWVDVTGDNAYICVDNSDGVALWVSTVNTFFARAGEAIKKGEAVYISGALGAARPTVSLCDADDVAKIRMAGIAAQDIGNGADGMIRTTGGLVKNVDTEGVTDANPDDEDWTAGDVLYVKADGSGGYTKTKPTSGRVIRAAVTLLGDHNSDTLFVTSHTNPVNLYGAATEDIILRLGASDDSTSISIKDFANAEVANIDDGGNADFTSVIVDTEIADAEISNTLTASIMAAGADADMNNLDIVEVKTVQFNGVYANGNSGATPTVNWQNGQYQSMTVSENTLITFSNSFVGTLTLVLTYGDAYSVGFDAGYTIHEEGGTEIVFTATAAAVDLLKVVYLGAANNYIVGALLDVKD